MTNSSTNNNTIKPGLKKCDNDNDNIEECDPPIENDDEEEPNFIDNKLFSSSSVSQLLSSYGRQIGHKLITEFEKADIRYQHLAELSEEDLELFGVESVTLREQMINDFKQMPNQIENYDETFKYLNTDVYLETTLKHLSQQINDIKTSVAITQRNLINPTEIPVNELIDPKTYSSQLVLKTLSEIDNYASVMEKHLNEIVSKQQQCDKHNSNPLTTVSTDGCGRCDEVRDDRNVKKRTFGKFCIKSLGILGFTLGGYFTYRFIINQQKFPLLK